VEEKSDEGKKEESEESDVKGKSDDTDHDKNDQFLNDDFGQVRLLATQLISLLALTYPEL
jgi:hypothetical protein